MMAITPTIAAPQAELITVTNQIAASETVPQAQTLAVYNVPAHDINAAYAGINGAYVQTAQEMPVSQLQVMVVSRGQFDNPRIRAWGYSQDGHDFYVLRLGMQATLIYDATTQTWSEWNGGNYPFWRTALGWDWISMGRSNYLDSTSPAASQIVGGDDTYGILWTLDPTQGYDENVDSTGDDVNVIRAVRSAWPFRGRHRSRTNGVWLLISNGAPVLPLAAVTLRTSDDQGVSWQDRGSITVTPGDYNQDLYWRSLGLMRAPGRLFEFEDNGAMIRIDGADLDMSKDDQGGPSN